MATEETLEQKVARLEQEKQALTTTNSTLKNQVTNLSSDKAALQAENSVLKTKFDDLMASSQEEIGNLSIELSKAKTIADKAEPTITVDKKEYAVIGQKFIYRRRGEVESKEITVAELLKDKLLQAELVKAGVGFLVPKK